MTSISGTIYKENRLGTPPPMQETEADAASQADGGNQ